MTDAEDLKQQLDAAYTSIQELDEDLAAGRLSAADHAELKERSERHAAALLKRLREAEQRGSRNAATRPGTSRPALGAMLASPLGLTVAAAGLLLFGIVLGVLVGRFTSDERPAVAVAATGAPERGPGISAAGQGAGTGPALSPALEALRKEVEVESPPIKKLLEFAHMALDEGQIPAAIWAYKLVLAREPKNVEAITHIAVILAQGNHIDDALKRLDEAIRLDPKYVHAHWDRAQILFNAKKDYRAAAAALEAFLKLMPTGEDAERGRAMLAEARKLAASGTRSAEGAASAAGGALPAPRHPPIPREAGTAATKSSPAKESAAPGR